MACHLRCPSIYLMHVKFEAPTNTLRRLSCCRESDLINDFNQQRLSCPTFGERDFRENYCAAPCCRPFFDVPNRYIVPESSWNGVQTGDLLVDKCEQEAAKASKQKQPPASRCRWRETISLISCCPLLLSFFFIWI